MTRDTSTNESVSLLGVFVVGAVAGLVGGVFGVGGGFLIVPGLIFVTGMDQRLAHGTSLAAVLPISLSSLITYALHDNVNWAAGIWLALGGVVGAIIGTRLLHVLPERLIAALFIVMLIVSAIRLFMATDATGGGSLSAATAVALVGIGIVTGVVAGLLGVGGGIVLVPAMILLFGFVPAVAKGTSVAVIIPTAVAGTWRNRKVHNVDLRAAAIVGCSGVVIAALGATISGRMSDTTSNVLFASLLVLVALRMAWQLVPR